MFTNKIINSDFHNWSLVWNVLRRCNAIPSFASLYLFSRSSPCWGDTIPL